MKAIVVVVSLLVIYFMYGFYLAQRESYVLPAELKRENPPGFYDYRGVTNVHTNLSTGSSSPAEVIAEAKRAGLDFLFITDVNQSERLDTVEGYNGGMMVMVGSEYTY